MATRRTRALVVALLASSFASLACSRQHIVVDYSVRVPDDSQTCISKCTKAWSGDEADVARCFKSCYGAKTRASVPCPIVKEPEAACAAVVHAEQHIDVGETSIAAFVVLGIVTLIVIIAHSGPLAPSYGN
jgi:hypothetical protein